MDELLKLINCIVVQGYHKGIGFKTIAFLTYRQMVYFPSSHSIQPQDTEKKGRGEDWSGVGKKRGVLLRGTLIPSIPYSPPSSPYCCTPNTFTPSFLLHHLLLYPQHLLTYDPSRTAQ